MVFALLTGKVFFYRARSARTEVNNDGSLCSPERLFVWLALLARRAFSVARSARPKSFFCGSLCSPEGVFVWLALLARRGFWVARSARRRSLCSREGKKSVTLLDFCEARPARPKGFLCGSLCSPEGLFVGLALLALARSARSKGDSSGSLCSPVGGRRPEADWPTGGLIGASC